MLRALIVEDNRFFREAFKTSLQERVPSVIIEAAGSGEEALQKIDGAPPDLIFTDMRLAGMNGLELAKKMKKDFPGIRIAMLAGYDFPEYRRAASQHGMDRFFDMNVNCYSSFLLQFSREITITLSFIESGKHPDRASLFPQK